MKYCYTCGGCPSCVCVSQAKMDAFDAMQSAARNFRLAREESAKMDPYVREATMQNARRALDAAREKWEGTK